VYVSEHGKHSPLVAVICDVLQRVALRCINFRLKRQICCFLSRARMRLLLRDLSGSFVCILFSFSHTRSLLLFTHSHTRSPLLAVSAASTCARACVLSFSRLSFWPPSPLSPTHTHAHAHAHALTLAGDGIERAIEIPQNTMAESIHEEVVLVAQVFAEVCYLDGSCVAVCCSVLQRVEVSVLQCVAACCSACCSSLF